MDIKTSDLKSFKTLSSNMKSSGVLPIHDYIKFGNGLIQKQTTGSFLKFECSTADEEILVEEKILYDLIAFCTSPVISITNVKGKTVISDLKNTISIQCPLVSEFTDVKIENEIKKEVSPNFLESIGSAAIVCHPMGTIPDKYMYVMVGNKSVTGISISYGYYRPIEEDFVMALEKTIALFISKTDVFACSVTDTHYIFYTMKGATIGFAKQAIGYGDFAKILREDVSKLTFTASNSDIRSYNSLAISLCKDGPVVTMTKKGELQMNDIDRDISQNQVIESVKPYEDFSYLPGQMNIVLSAMAAEELDFHQLSHMFIIKDSATKSVAAIGKIQKQN